MDSRSAVSELFLDTMKRYDVTQGWVAEQAGVSRTAINALLNDPDYNGMRPRRDGDVALVDRVAHVLGIPPLVLNKAMAQDHLRDRVEARAVIQLEEVRAAKSLDEAAQKRRGTKAQDGIGCYPQTHRDQRKHFRPTPADEGKRAGSAVKRPA